MRFTRASVLLLLATPLWALSSGCEPETPEPRVKDPEGGSDTGDDGTDDDDDDDDDEEGDDDTGTGTGSGTGTGEDGGCVDPTQVLYGAKCINGGSYVFLRDAITVTDTDAANVSGASPVTALALPITGLAVGDKVLLAGQAGFTHDTGLAAPVTVALRADGAATPIAAFHTDVTAGMEARSMFASGMDVVGTAGDVTYETTLQSEDGRLFPIPSSGAQMTALVFHEYTVAELAAAVKAGGDVPGYFFVRADKTATALATEVPGGDTALGASALPSMSIAEKAGAYLAGDVAFVRGMVSGTVNVANESTCAGATVSAALAQGDTLLGTKQQVKMHQDQLYFEIPMFGVLKPTADGSITISIRMHVMGIGCTVKTAFMVGIESLVFRSTAKLASFIGSAGTMVDGGSAAVEDFNLVTGPAATDPDDPAAPPAATSQLVVEHPVTLVAGDTVSFATQLDAVSASTTFTTRYYGQMSREVNGAKSMQAGGWLDNGHAADGVWQFDVFTATGDTETLQYKMLAVNDANPPTPLTLNGHMVWLQFRAIAK